MCCFRLKKPSYILFKHFKEEVFILISIFYVLHVVGYKIVWSGNFDGQTCDIERYQPISHFNLDGSNCIFKKSSCNEEGQITVEDGSQRADRLCRCDYRR